MPGTPSHPARIYIDHTAHNGPPTIIFEGNCMEDTTRTFPDDSHLFHVENTGDLIDMQERGPGANDRYTPEAAQRWVDKIIEQGYSSHRLFRREWFQTDWPTEPSHVTQRLHGIARMSLRSPGKPQRP